MGKLIFFVSVLIFMYLLLLTTGQIDLESADSITSIVIKGIINMGELSFQDWFKQMLGDIFDFANSSAGIGALIVGSAVTLGTSFFASSEQRIYIPIAFSLGLLTNDFIFIFNNLGLNLVISSFIFVPLGIIFTLTVLEWLRGRD